MKDSLLWLLLLVMQGALFADEKRYSVAKVPSAMSVQEKKARFYALVVPAVTSVYNDLMQQYNDVATALKNPQATKKIAALKRLYHVKSDADLLIALKPHPPSITIAQAAMESAWGTSRFFREANNIFGVHSANPNEPRVAAGEKKGKWRVWMRKFPDLKSSVAAYYKMMATVPEYRAFKRMNYQGSDVYTMLKGLRAYSERGDAYVKELGSMIRYNKLQKYDPKVAKAAG